MNVFILNSGRCGSMSFIRACSHMTNYTSAHESRVQLAGTERLAYPPRHIEADNRLSWFLGRLDEAYGDRAAYVHLSRDPQAVIASYARRSGFGIMQAYRHGILMHGMGVGLAPPPLTDADIAADYLATVQANIAAFLRNKTRVFIFQMEQAQQDFPRFWKWIAAEGNLQRALEEWEIRHNASIEPID